MVHSGTALVDPYKVFAKIKLSPGMRVADFGCGRTGHFVFPSARIVGETGVVYAIDIIKNILESIKSLAKSEGYDNVRTVWSNIELAGGVSIPERSLDACFFVNVLFQLKDRQAAIKEAARLLKQNGFLVIIDWVKKLGPLGPEPEHMITEEDLINMAKQAGLDVVERDKMNDYHYLLILRKIV